MGTWSKPSLGKSELVMGDLIYLGQKTKTPSDVALNLEGFHFKFGILMVSCQLIDQSVDLAS